MQTDGTARRGRDVAGGRRPTFAMALAAIGALLVAGCGTAAPDYLAEASSALERGDRAAATTALRAHLRTAPESSDVRLRLASLLRESKPDEALEILARIPQSDPQRIAAMQQVAIIQIVAGRTAAAEQALREVVAAQPENLGAQLSLAELYFRDRIPESALPHALAAARLAPNRAQTFLLIAEIHDELHDYAAMIEPLQAAIAIDPGSYDARLNLAYASNRIGDLETAEVQAKWCLNANPREVSALRILATIARDQGRFADARSFIAKAQQIQPEDVDCRILEADMLLYERQPQAAYERLKEIFNAHRSTVRYLGALARAAALAGDREESRKHYRTVERLVQESRKKVEPRQPQAPGGDSAPR